MSWNELERFRRLWKERIGFWEHRGNPRELWFVEALHNGREMGSDPSRDTNDVASISSRCHRGSDPFSLPLCKAVRWKETVASTSEFCGL